MSQTTFATSGLATKKGTTTMACTQPLPQVGSATKRVPRQYVLHSHGLGSSSARRESIKDTNKIFNTQRPLLHEGWHLKAALSTTRWESTREGRSCCFALKSAYSCLGCNPLSGLADDNGQLKFSY